jgi:ribosomal protein S18 acetylase RimI-like enzyme
LPFGTGTPSSPGIVAPRNQSGSAAARGTGPASPALTRAPATAKLPCMSARVSVRKIRGDEGPLLRDVRLRALADSPDAFGSTYADELSLTEAAWTERAEHSARDDDRVTFIAEGLGRVVGMVMARLDPEVAGRAGVFGLWVEPVARSAGTGQALMSAVAEWAAERGATVLTLWVVQSNTEALALYGRIGFRRTDERMAMPGRTSLVEVRMEKALG